jgi:hypothetical protein
MAASQALAHSGRHQVRVAFDGTYRGRAADRDECQSTEAANPGPEERTTAEP